MFEEVEMGNPRENFDNLYEDYRGKIYRVILRVVRNPLEAEELTQETFIKVERNLPHLKRPESVASWLYRIATNTALDYLRRVNSRDKKGVTELSLEDGKAISTNTSSPPSSLDRTESTRCVRQYADRLPEQYSVVLVLHDLEGLPLTQVAEVMGSSVGATKVRLHRARKRFTEICGAECEQFYDEEGVLSCQPRSMIPLVSANNSCCVPDS
jgi:RNA polymerase sigma-70 factor (ECF subfamily)